MKEYYMLKYGDIILEGDEWASNSYPDRWCPVYNSIGKQKINSYHYHFSFRRKMLTKRGNKLL